MRKMAVVLVLAGLVAGCDNYSPTAAQKSEELQLVVPAEISPQAKQLIAESWPKVNKACPGLGKYARALKVVAIEDDLARDEGYRKVTVEIKVPDGASEIPREHHAMGHHCFLDIAPDGQSVTVTKRACVSVVLDKEFDINGGQVTIPLL